MSCRFLLKKHNLIFWMYIFIIYSYKRVLPTLNLTIYKNLEEILNLKKGRRRPYSTFFWLLLNEYLINILQAESQCSGEAEYTGDKPVFHNQLYAAFVLSTQVLQVLTNTTEEIYAVKTTNSQQSKEKSRNAFLIGKLFPIICCFCVAINSII